jgi:hypothetical protein
MFSSYEEIPYYNTIRNMTAAYSRTPSTLVVEFDTVSYWHLHSVAYLPVFPKHIMQNWTVEEILEWNPSSGDESLVTSGPFILDQYEVSEIITLVANEDYPYIHVQTITQTTTTETFDIFDFFDGVGEFLFSSTAISAVIVLSVSIVILAFGIKKYRIWK